MTTSVNRNLGRGIAAGAVLLLAQSAAVAQNNGLVQGLIYDARGQPVAGAMVKLKHELRRLTFMVVSREQGRFEAKDLPPGQYSVQAIGGDMRSSWFDAVYVNASGSANTKVSLALNYHRGPDLPAAWPQRIPEEQVRLVSVDPKDLPEGEGKTLVAERCASCHDLRRVVVKRSNHDHWAHTTARMRTRMTTANIPDLTAAEYDTIVNYLVANFPEVQPYDANSRLPRTLLSGKAVSYRVVTYALVNSHAEPHDVAADPQGNAWVSERAGKLGKFDPRALTFTERDTPPGPAAKDRQSLGNPQIDAKGILWVADGPNSRWLSYDTNTDRFLAFAFPRGKGNAGGNSMALHPDGTIWATGGGKEARQLFPEKVEFKFYEAPAAKTHKNPGAYGLAVAGDNSVWFAEDETDLMARVDPATGNVDEYKIPLNEQAYPRRMGADANGDLWVALWTAGKLMKVDHKTRAMTIYTPPTKVSGHYSVVVDKKQGYVWVSEHMVDKIARFDPRTEEWVEFPMAEAESDPRRIDIDPTNPNRIFFAGNIPGRVGFIEVLPQ